MKYAVGMFHPDVFMSDSYAICMVVFQMNIVLKLWKSGFTVNDSPVRLYTDPQNQQFLQSVQKGYVLK